MQYQQALKELRKFADDPCDPKSVTVGDLLSLRIAVRTVVNTIEVNGDHVFGTLNRKQGTFHSLREPRQSSYPKTESLKVRIVDFIRESDKGGGVPMVDVFREFRISVSDMIRNIGQSYGIVSKTIDNKGNVTFYYWADSWVQVYDKLKEMGRDKLPKDHKVIGE